MFKKSFLLILAIVSIAALIFAGCSLQPASPNDDTTDPTLEPTVPVQPVQPVQPAQPSVQPDVTPIAPQPDVHTLSYYVQGVLNTVQVQQGQSYFVDVPERTGYIFDGLYTQPQGGVQYVDAQGASLAPYAEGGDLCLYAQFLPDVVTVRFYTEDGALLQKSTQVPSGTPFDEVAPKRLADGTTVNGWSLSMGGDPIVLTELNVDSVFYVASCVYSVTLVDGMGSTQTQSVPNGGTVVLPNLSQKGRTFEGWFDADGNPQQTDVPIRPYGSKVFSARWRSNSYPVHADPAEGQLAQTDCTVVYGSNFCLPVPVRSGYMFAGWYSGEIRLTDSNGNSLQPYLNDGPLSVAAHWLQNSATFSDNTSYLITDSGRSKQHIDTVPLAQMLGASLADYIAAGAKCVEVYYSLEIAEIDDGYQHIFLSTDTKAQTLSSQLIFWDYFEHGRFFTETHSFRHEKVLSLPITDFADTVYILYGASGVLNDDWLRNSVRMTFTIK